jgi:hypothetical protein
MAQRIRCEPKGRVLIGKRKERGEKFRKMRKIERG